MNHTSYINAKDIQLIDQIYKPQTNIILSCVYNKLNKLKPGCMTSPNAIG